MASILDEILTKWQETAFNLYFYGIKNEKKYNEMLNEVLEAAKTDSLHPSVQYMKKFKNISEDAKLHAIMMHKFH